MTVCVTGLPDTVLTLVRTVVRVASVIEDDAGADEESENAGSEERVGVCRFKSQ